jgi:hypothetical protein
MSWFLIIFLLVVLPLVSLMAKSPDLDDRDRRGWFPHARAR